MKNFLLFLLFLTPLIGNATLFTWTGGNIVDATTVADAANWTPAGGPPTATDDVVFSGSSVTISTNLTYASIELQSGVDVIIDMGVVITLGNDDGVDTNGALDMSSSSATLINNGTINIINAAEDGIEIKGAFTNNGTIDIDGYGVDGISVTGGLTAIFTNNGTIDIDIAMGASGTNNAIDVRDDGLFVNNGTITIPYSDEEAIYVNSDGGTFDNSGMITISDTGASDHGIEVRSTFNNLAGGVIKVLDSGGDGIRVEPTGTFNFAGTIVMAVPTSASDGIENNGGTFNTMGGTIEAGCNDDVAVVEIQKDLDISGACLNFDVTGTSSSNYDRLRPQNGDLTITGANVKVDLGSFEPNEGNCFRVIDGRTSGGVETANIIGTFASITSPANPNITWSATYEAHDVLICIDEIVALPVELTHFSGKETSQGAQLNWTTASELNNKGFEIERSSDSERWTNIGFVLGNGTVNTAVQYDFVDKTPTRGINYYRLKQVDFDGAFEYSNIIALDFEGDKGGVSIYPNPVGTILNVSMSETLEDVQVQLYDVSGKILWSQKGIVSQIAFDDYAPGVYYLEVVSSVGQSIQKVVRNK